MSLPLQTQQLLEPELVPVPVPSADPLNRETGWTEVGTGLTRVLIGYLLSFLCVCLGVGLLVWLTLHAVAGDITSPKNRTEVSVVLLVGGCFLGLLSLVSYGFVLVGKWNCAMHAPERHGARWFIFATIICMVVGPVVNIITPFAGGNENVPVRPGVRPVAPQGTVSAALTRSPTTIQLAASAVSLATTLFFVLFLRSVGLCFGCERYSRMTEMFLSFTGLLLGFTFYLLYTVPLQEIPLLILLGLGVGWLVSLVAYVGLVIGARILINVGLERFQASRLS
jgi:hypothetical protein